MQIAVLGLGKMGMQIAKRLSVNGFEVLAWNRSNEPRNEFKKFISVASSKNQASSPKSQVYKDIESLINHMNGKARVFWLMLPHIIVDEFLHNQLGPYLKSGDIVIDGGNSFYKDSIRRAEELSKRRIIFYDCGTSGGVWGEKNGFALMVGGPKEQWPIVEPIFKTLSGAENYGLVGKNGAGHFVKMVHNGIEYGMMESIAEGYGVLHASEFNLNLSQVTKVYQEGSVIKSWLIDLCRDIFENENIEQTSGVIGATGEGEWTVNAGKELGVDVRVIEEAYKVRLESKELKNQQKFSNKIVSLLRKQFGGHGVQKNE